MRRLLTIGLLSVITLLFVASPVLAIANPDTIWFGTKTPIKYVKAFENVGETGDMLFLAEGFVDYAVTPDDYNAGEAFILQLISTDGLTVLSSRPLEEWGERPISIYLTAAQVTALGLASPNAYIVRITGNPLIFPVLTEDINMVTYTLGAGDWIDQSLATATANPLRNACIYIAENMEEEDGFPTPSYLTESGGVTYLTPAGGTIFVRGVPGLDVFVPSLFQVITEVLEAPDPDATGDYVAVVTPLLRLGPEIAGGLTDVGVWLGVSQAMAAGLILFGLMVMLSVWLFQKTQSGKVVIGLGLAAALPVGTFLGMSSLVLLFIIVIFIVLLMGYYFLTRGAL